VKYYSCCLNFMRVKHVSPKLLSYLLLLYVDYDMM